MKKQWSWRKFLISTLIVLLNPTLTSAADKPLCPFLAGSWACQGEIPTFNDIVEIQQRRVDGEDQYVLPFRAEDPEDFAHSTRLASGRKKSTELPREGLVDITTTCSNADTLTDIFEAPTLNKTVTTVYVRTAQTLRIERSTLHLDNRENQISTCKKR